MVFLAWLACLTDQEIERALDQDGDGFLAGDLDCDDDDPAVHPGVEEQCDDGIDNNCDGNVDDFGAGALFWYRDADGDGYGNNDVRRESCLGWADGESKGWTSADDLFDCDDSDGTVWPDAPELCDAIDNDCDGTVDEGAC